MSDTIAVEARIRGRVQGVWYRGWTDDEATRRGLSGWVRNEPDGTVSALFVGPRAAVEEMLAACREGPIAARVDAVERREIEPPTVTGGFRTLR
ncbi:MAG TPA: acylphosphatase [Paracoccaceae bacterium]|nr:acylphosphatase [Paracoccaceae bacterium]